MTVSDTHLRANTASGAAADQGGGAIYNDGGELVVTGSMVEANKATGAAGSGGGVLSLNGSLDMAWTNLNGNTAPRAGGAVEVNGGSADLSNVNAANNSTGAAPGNGGALHITGAGTVTWAVGSVTGNRAANEGGGLWNSATGTFTATGITFDDNTSPEGPDAYNDGGVMTVNGALILPGRASDRSRHPYDDNADAPGTDGPRGVGARAARWRGISGASRPRRRHRSGRGPRAR